MAENNTTFPSNSPVASHGAYINSGAAKAAGGIYELVSALKYTKDKANWAPHQTRARMRATPNKIPRPGFSQDPFLMGYTRGKAIAYIMRFQVRKPSIVIRYNKEPRLRSP